jgi:hypothetical protein
MKHKIKSNGYKEIEIAEGYYRVENDYYSIFEGRIVRCLNLGNFSSIGTSISEYDLLDEATPITKDEFDAELEKAFEIIRGKL